MSGYTICTELGRNVGVTIRLASQLVVTEVLVD